MSVLRSGELFAGVAVINCTECGHRHPITCRHCDECGSPSLVPHHLHAGEVA